AKYMADICPSAMVFIPCRDGISHNEIESAEPEHATVGVDVLLLAVLEKAQEPG
ncbi:MAG: Zn-dependent hydrolase, partial [Alphaproteobacteria bacterium]|nr:Zn-dependent hydrolase [Alphaproteobacteria bacterium]